MKKKSAKKKAAKKSEAKIEAKKTSNKSLSPEEKKTKIIKLVKERDSIEDQKEKKNIRAKLRAIDPKWKEIAGIKSEKKSAKKKAAKKSEAKSTSSEANKTKKKKKKAATV